MIVWTCDVCGERIKNGTGYLTVDYAAIGLVERAVAEYRGKPHTLADVPDRARWSVLHRACDPNPESTDYWIGTERIRTKGQVIEWAAHLSDKQWIQHTTWADVLRRVA